MGLLEGYQHQPGALELVCPDERGTNFMMNTKTLHEGGRLSRRLVDTHRAEIEAFLGRSLTEVP